MKTGGVSFSGYATLHNLTYAEARNVATQINKEVKAPGVEIFLVPKKGDNCNLVVDHPDIAWFRKIRDFIRTQIKPQLLNESAKFDFECANIGSIRDRVNIDDAMKNKKWEKLALKA
jgi:hypothetical protein